MAGSGKTTTLAAIAEAYELAGIPVAGVAPTGAAARVMTEAGAPARTVDRALLDREDAVRAGPRPTPGIVLVDEAGAIGTRTLARLAEAVSAADAKLVLVGDDAQLPAVAAGAAYSELVAQTHAVHSLETPPKREIASYPSRFTSGSRCSPCARNATVIPPPSCSASPTASRSLTRASRDELARPG